MITRCKDCNEIIGYGLDELFNNPNFKVKQGTTKDFNKCLECYEKKKAIK